MFKRRKKQTPKANHPIREIYKDKFGNRWFEFEDKMNVPAKRAIACEVATRFADLNLTKDKLKHLIDKMKDNANKGDIVGLFNILSEVEFRLDFIGEQETLLELASIYFLIEGEDADQMVESVKKKKKEIFEQDGDAKDFFLSRVFNVTKNFSELSERDFLKYLKENQVNVERISRFLPANMSVDTLTT